MKSQIIKITKTDFKLEIQPFEDDNLIYVFKTKKRELYELYSQLRIIFETQEE